jgi:hypothetical protein
MRGMVEEVESVSSIGREQKDKRALLQNGIRDWLVPEMGVCWLCMDTSFLSLPFLGPSISRLCKIESRKERFVLAEKSFPYIFIAPSIQHT